MAQFLLANMTGPAGAFAATYTADVGGVPTTIIGTDQGALNGSGRLYGPQSWYKFASATPIGANYSVSGNFYSYQDINEEVALLGRVQSDTAHYRFRYTQANWILEYYNASSYSQLGIYAMEPADDTHYVPKLEMIGTAIKGYVDGVQRISVTDSNITLAGVAGCYVNAGSGYLSIDQLSADDIASATVVAGRGNASR